MSYSTRIITNDAEFLSLGDTWDALVATAADANTFLTHAWLSTWWMSYRPRASLCIVLAEREGAVTGIAPMMLMRDVGLGGIFRRLRFVGDGTSETDHMNFIVCNHDRQQVLDHLLRVIDQLPWDIAHINQIPESSPNAGQFLEYANSKNWLLSTKHFPCPRRELPSSFDVLMATLPNRLRTAIRSARREMHKSRTVEFGYVTKKEELKAALEVLYRNHEGRWNTKGKPGVFVDERKRAFYAELSARLLDAGALRFFHLKLDGKIVAQQYCFAYDTTVMLLQEGFDVDFAKLNVGNVLRAMVFEHLIEHGVKVYDFLEGTSRHKQSWSDSAPCDLSIRACRPSLAGRLAFHLPRWAANLKNLFRPAAGIET